MSAEHVIPRAFGGALQNGNPFKISTVCKRCNSACGRWVDGPLIRSWFVQNARALAGTQFVEPAADPIVPLFYLGRSANWLDDAKVCDLWLGPTGDAIFHFHRPYPSEPALVGRPPAMRPGQLDPGAVFVVIVGTNPDWHPILQRSIFSAFPTAPIFYLNGIPKLPVPVEHEHERDWVASHISEAQKVEVTVDLTGGDRFAAKLALGVGALFLDDSFKTSEDANRLRRFMWTRDHADREKIPLGGVGLFHADEKVFLQLANWKDCHFIYLFATGDRCGVTMTFYGRRSMTVVITTNPDLWKDRVSGDGIVWVIAPGLRRFAGPMTLGQYLAAKQDPSDGPLADLDRHFAAAKTAPPFHLGSQTGDPA